MNQEPRERTGVVRLRALLIAGALALSVGASAWYVFVDAGGWSSADAGQQSNAKSDVEITREIRRAVVKDHSLSMLAHNVKIVSANGSVTLRGPVKTEEEKTAIASKAQAIAGAGKVDDQLEVKGQ